MSESTTQSARPDLSFVIPVLNESKTVSEVCDGCRRVAGELGKTCEIIVVDDGSTDGTDEVLRKQTLSHPDVTAIVFQRNFGKSSALSAGLRRALGRIVVTLDADMQDNPDELPSLLEQLDAGSDVVVGWKQRRRDSLSRIVASRVFNWLVSRMASRKFRDCNSGFKVMRRTVIAHLDLYGERHRFLPLLAHWNGFGVCEVPVRHEPRKYGRSRYGAGRFLAGFFDLWSMAVLTRFRHRPLHFFGLVGALAFSIGFIILGTMTVLRLTLKGYWFGNHMPMAFLGILLVLVGIQVFTTGLICELVVNLRPERSDDYVIKEVMTPPERTNRDRD